MDPKDIENKFPYSGIPTFYKLQHTTDLKNVDVALIGIPFDQGTTNRSGTRFGPRAVRIASQNYGIYMHSDEGAYDLEQKKHILHGVNLIDYGDVPILPTSTATNMRMIHDTFKKIIDSGVFTVGFGGDHSITFPILEAFDIDFDIVHFDTHLDFTDNVANVKFSHASPIKRASGLENVNDITQVGIRGFTDRKANFDEATKYNSKIITASDIFKNGIKWTLEEIPEAENIYVTLDIDVLDISVVPGTGTPEPGGLSYLQMREILQNLRKKGNIIGFDVVEVNPLYDAGNMTSQVASRLAIDFLGSIYGK
ncbi:agmatinase [Methanobacterium sp.]|uniref:agmatinase n=1 Tax=Methanobacterium sp. TaxID=2164 RepID=UPI003C73AEED